MKHFLTLFFSLASFAVFAQGEFYQVMQGTGYGQQVFYDLKTNTGTTINNEDWDIAFKVGGFSASIIINESVTRSQDTYSLVELYATDATDFASVTEGMEGEQLYNNKGSWENGAFTTIATPGNPADLGWGTYDFGTNVVNGSRIFIIAGVDGVKRKIEVQTLDNGIYTFRHALLDGTEETTVSIDKSDYAGKTFAYYSFTNGAQDLEPDSWHIVFTRYSDLLTTVDPPIWYTVTGVLQNDGVKVAQIDGSDDPENEPTPLAESAYLDSIDVIGWDWKIFSGMGFETLDDRAYFIRLADGQTSRLVFNNFEGSATGVSTIIAECLGTVVGTTELPTNVQAAYLYPNPARQQTHLFVNATLGTTLRGQLQLYNVNGQQVDMFNQNVQLVTGENRLPLPLDGLAAGQYIVRLELGNGAIVQPLLIH